MKYEVTSELPKALVWFNNSSVGFTNAVALSCVALQIAPHCLSRHNPCIATLQMKQGTLQDASSPSEHRDNIELSKCSALTTTILDGHTTLKLICQNKSRKNEA